jgi:hypothetical protein
MFFFKKQQIVVDCFTYNNSVYDYKPLPSSKFLPKEWKSLPKSIDIKVNQDPTSKLSYPVPTLKLCDGFVDLFSNSFMLQSWADISIECNINGDLRWHTLSNLIQFQNHAPHQVWDSFYSGYSPLKLISPWALSESSGIKFSWNRCDWLNYKDADTLHILSGIVDYKYQNGSHINMYVKHNSLIKINAGQPLVTLTPLTDKKVVFKYHLLTYEEYQSRYCNNTVYMNKTKESKRLQNFNKCPFGFKS